MRASSKFIVSRDVTFKGRKALKNHANIAIFDLWEMRTIETINHQNCDVFIKEMPFVSSKFNEILRRDFREVSEEYLIMGKFLSIKGVQLPEKDNLNFSLIWKRHHYR
mgnify:FL=1